MLLQMLRTKIVCHVIVIDRNDYFLNCLLSTLFVSCEYSSVRTELFGRNTVCTAAVNRLVLFVT